MPAEAKDSSDQHNPLYEAAVACRSAGDIAAFIRAILADNERVPLPQYWQNDLGQQFLDAVAAWIEDADGMDTERAAIPPHAYAWFAKALYCGVIYE